MSGGTASAVAPSAMDRARAAWGLDLPDWVEALARACDETSQAAAARAMGYTPAVVSGLIRRTYTADLGRVEQAARGAFLAAVVDCPVLGTIPTSQCLSHQRAPFSPASHDRVRLFRACRAACPHSRLHGA